MIVALFIRCIHNLLHTLSQRGVMPRIGDCCMVESFDGLAIMENLGKIQKNATSDVARFADFLTFAESHCKPILCG